MSNDTAEKQRAHRKRRLAKGQCRYCSKERVSMLFCAQHLEKERLTSIRKRKRRVLSHRCLMCNIQLDEEADAGYICCINCREKITKPVKQFQRRRYYAIDTN